MIVTFAVSALWLLGMLACVAFVQSVPLTRAVIIGAVAGFAVVLPLALFLSPQPNWVSVLLSSAIIWRLIAGPSARTAGLLAGLCAALVAALQIASGVSAALAAPVSFVGLAVAFVWGKGGGGGLRWEWVLFACALAIPPLGLINEIIYGWQSAAALKQGATTQNAVATPDWAIALVGASLIAGLVRGLWIKR